jgi:hypothetical protein
MEITFQHKSRSNAVHPASPGATEHRLLAPFDVASIKNIFSDEQRTRKSNCALSATSWVEQ